MDKLVVGKVVEPELRNVVVKGERREKCVLGVISGLDYMKFEVFDDKKIFQELFALKNGAYVIVEVWPKVDDKGNIRWYLNSISECPESLYKELMSHMKR